MNEQESDIKTNQDSENVEIGTCIIETDNCISEICACFIELMIPYMTGRLDKTDTRRLLLHLTTCKKCREEYVELHRLTTTCSQESTVLLDSIKLHAFDLIEYPKLSTTILKGLGIDIVKESFQLLPVCLSPVKDTLQLTLRCIQL